MLHDHFCSLDWVLGNAFNDGLYSQSSAASPLDYVLVHSVAAHIVWRFEITNRILNAREYGKLNSAHSSTRPNLFTIHDLMILINYRCDRCTIIDLLIALSDQPFRGVI